MTIAEVRKIRELKPGEKKYQYGLNHDSKVAFCFLTADTNNVVGLVNFKDGEHGKALEELKNKYNN